jgi:hypothetical protein
MRHTETSAPSALKPRRICTARGRSSSVKQTKIHPDTSAPCSDALEIEPRSTLGQTSSVAMTYASHERINYPSTVSGLLDRRAELAGRLMRRAVHSVRGAAGSRQTHAIRHSGSSGIALASIRVTSAARSSLRIGLAARARVSLVERCGRHKREHRTPHGCRGLSKVGCERNGRRRVRRLRARRRRGSDQAPLRCQEPAVRAGKSSLF